MVSFDRYHFKLYSRREMHTNMVRPLPVTGMKQLYSYMALTNCWQYVNSMLAEFFLVGNTYTVRIYQYATDE